MTDALPYLAAIALGYLLGSIPFGLVITRLAGLGDIRDIGSGNIGATNVLRTGRKDLALATFLLDSGKAGLAFLFILLAFSDRNPALIAGATAFLGHCFPVWLGFKGGKGVATFFGLLIFAMWKVAAIAAATWLSVAFLTRYSSFAALCAATVAPVAAWFIFGDLFPVAVLTALGLLIFWRHRENISRLLKGTESRIGGNKTAPAPETDA